MGDTDKVQHLGRDIPRAQIVYPDYFREYDWIQYTEETRDARLERGRKRKEILGPRQGGRCSTPPPPTLDFVLALMREEFLSHAEVRALYKVGAPMTQDNGTLWVWFNGYLQEKYDDGGMEPDAYMRLDTVRQAIEEASVAAGKQLREGFPTDEFPTIESFVRHRLAEADARYRERLELEAKEGFSRFAVKKV